MRRFFLFSCLLLILVYKYFGIQFVYGVALFLLLYFRKSFFYILIILIIVTRLFFVGDNNFVPSESGDLMGHICSFASEFSNANSIELCLVNGKKVLVYYKPYLEFKIGDYGVFDLSCELVNPKMRFYFAISDIFYKCDLLSFRILESENPYYIFLKYISKIRYNAHDKLFRALHYPAADLASGLLFGFRANFEQSFKLAFNNLSLTHLIAISGYNVSLFLLLVDRSLFFINRKLRMYIYPLALLFFIFITGIQSSVIRACLMAQIQLLALSKNRMYEPLDALVVVIFVISLINPLRMYYDIGLWLSLVSTLGIVLFSKPLIAFLRRFLNSDVVCEVVGMSFISFVATFLISSVFFNNYNLFSIVPNLFVAPIVPIIMFLAFQFCFVASNLFAPLYIFFIDVLTNVFVFIINICVIINVFVLEKFKILFTIFKN